MALNCVYIFRLNNYKLPHMFFTVPLHNLNFNEEETKMKRNVFIYGLLIVVLVNLVEADSSGKLKTL